ncbi:MAG TPA: hypothetical protein VIY96_02805 [Thermoanaerobaculia bacterium]
MWGRDTAARVCFEALLSILLFRADLAFAQASGPGGEPRISVLGRPDPDLILAVNEIVPKAATKLQSFACQAVFSDFKDSAGRTLRENLETKGQTGTVYLKWLIFLNGSDDQFCLNSHIVAGTNPNDRFIRLCGPLFKSIAKTDSGYAAALVIHEALHSLGLPENPPSSDAITRKVVERCGR